jgi:hypothetical protein
LLFFCKIKNEQEAKKKEAVYIITAALSKRTQILNGVIALLVVHFDGLGVRAANAITNGIASDHNVLILWRSPAHYNAGDKRADVKGARHFRNTSFWEGK